MSAATNDDRKFRYVLEVHPLGHLGNSVNKVQLSRSTKLSDWAPVASRRLGSAYFAAQLHESLIEMPAVGIRQDFFRDRPKIFPPLN